MAVQLTNAEAFQFETLDGERLELFGALLSVADEVDTGLVEHQVVKRSGAIHQRVGAKPRTSEARCIIHGPTVTAQYKRICDVLEAQPEGRITHLRWGSYRAVCKSVSATETPGDEIDTILFTLKFAETGLRAPPKPAPAAKAATAATQGAQVATLTAGESAAIAAAGAAVSARAAGYLVAIGNAETGLGNLPDVDASLATLAQAVADLDALNAPKEARRAAVLALASAGEARNRLLAGRPPLIPYPVVSVESLSTLCQRLYGKRANDRKAEILRLNRIARPYAMPGGLVLLLPDPSYRVKEG